MKEIRRSREGERDGCSREIVEERGDYESVRERGRARNRRTEIQREKTDRERRHKIIERYGNT